MSPKNPGTIILLHLQVITTCNLNSFQEIHACVHIYYLLYSTLYELLSLLITEYTVSNIVTID